MSYHHVWLTKCNGVECDNAHVEATPKDPDGWLSDGTQHLCPACVEKRNAEQVPEEEPATE